MRPTQPSDEWQYLRQDDDLDPVDGIVEASDATVHVERDVADARAWSDHEPGDDPDAPPVFHFDDEEPDVGEPRDRGAVREHEPDLEEILESQHYAFPDEVD